MKTEQKQELDYLLNFIKSLNPEEQKFFRVFVEGYRARGLAEKQH